MQNQDKVLALAGLIAPSLPCLPGALVLLTRRTFPDILWMGSDEFYLCDSPWHVLSSGLCRLGSIYCL